MRALVLHLGDAWTWLRDFAAGLSVRRDNAPIDSVDRLDDFVATRSALITQKKLYGYLQERMGLSYPKMFADEKYAASIRLAIMHVFAAALADMTVHAVAHAGAGGRLDAEAHRRMAMSCYRNGIAANASRLTDAHDPDAWYAAFEQRLQETLWNNIAAGSSAFVESPKALIRWAPISEEYKELDRDIVENSIRFAWNEVLTDFRKRLDPDKVSADWKAHAPSGA
jgi:hypothetical protein